MKEPLLGFIKKELGGDFALIACGLPSTGKTGITREIARVKDYPVLRSDLIRLEVLKGENVFDERIAADMARRTAVYEEMFRRADEALGKHPGVILDATFITQELRRRAAGIAARHHLPFIIVEAQCPEEVAIRRIRSRTEEDYQSNALTAQAYLNNKKAFEKVDVDDLRKLFPELPVTHIVVDTAGDSPQEWVITSITENQKRKGV